MSEFQNFVANFVGHFVEFPKIRGHARQSFRQGCRGRRLFGQALDNMLARQSYPRRARGFTILEVIIACALFFIVSFAILGMVSQGLVGAKALQQKHPDAGLLASELTLTNQLIEGVESGDFEELYPDIYPGYTWTREVLEVYSNGMFQVTFAIQGPGGNKRGDSMTINTIYLWRPNSPPGSASKGGLGQ